MTNQVILKPITMDDLTHMEASGIIREVVNGQWIESDESMAGKRHGKIEAMLIFLLMSYLLKGTKENIEIMRMPDVSFVALGREDDENPDEVHFLAPDLAIEIISPSECYSEIRAKLSDYLESGVKQVWQVLPERKEVVVNLPDGTAKTYPASEKISGGEVLPGFELLVADIFVA